MDSETYIELSKDDEMARRLTSLALAFMNAKTPLTSSDIWHNHYEDLSKDSFTRTFNRDRAKLASCGFTIEDAGSIDDEHAWSVNAEKTFADGAQLEAVDAMTVNVACQPLLDDPGFPYSEELRFALAKIDQTFGGGRAIKSSEVRRNKVLTELRECHANKVAAECVYENAAGEKHERELLPYGFFSLRGFTYVVAADVNDQKAVKTYRLDRFHKVTAGKKTYQVPDDFDVSDWKKLPFQIGPALFEATFLVPESEAAEVRQQVHGRGSWQESEAGLLWAVEASSAKDAAAWAVATGVTPTQPGSLVEAYKQLLKGVVSRG
jgi:hypothetical protein